MCVNSLPRVPQSTWQRSGRDSNRENRIMSSVIGDYYQEEMDININNMSVWLLCPCAVGACLRPLSRSYTTLNLCQNSERLFGFQVCFLAFSPQYFLSDIFSRRICKSSIIRCTSLCVLSSHQFESRLVQVRVQIGTTNNVRRWSQLVKRRCQLHAACTCRRDVTLLCTGARVLMRWCKVTLLSVSVMGKLETNLTCTFGFQKCKCICHRSR